MRKSGRKRPALDVRVGDAQETVRADTLPAIHPGIARALGIDLQPLAVGGRGYGRETVWLEVPVTKDWTAAFRVVVADAGPQIAEVRVYPAEIWVDPATDVDQRPPGSWSGEYLGIAARCPTGGVTARLLRRVPTSLYARHAQKVLEALRTVPSWARRFEQWGLAPAGRTTRTRQAYTDDAVAAIARAYAARVAAGSRRPVADVAAHRGLPATVVRDMVHRARVRGFLTRTARGRFGGGLTPRGRAMSARKEKTTR